MTPMEFQVGGVKYRTKRLDPFKQFHVVRRLAPLVTGFGESLKKEGAIKTASIDELHQLDPLVIVGPLMETISKLTDEDTDFVLKTLLSGAQREVAPNAWQDVAAGGRLMYDDLELPTILQIAWHVLRGNLAGFLDGLRAAGVLETPTSGETSLASS